MFESSIHGSTPKACGYYQLYYFKTAFDYYKYKYVLGAKIVTGTLPRKSMGCYRLVDT